MSSHRERLKKLGRRLLVPVVGTCMSCGAPRPGQDVYMVVDDDGRPIWGRCKECGRALNRHGKALAAWPLRPGEQPMGVKLYGPNMPLDEL